MRRPILPNLVARWLMVLVATIGMLTPLVASAACPLVTASAAALASPSSCCHKSTAPQHHHSDPAENHCSSHCFTVCCHATTVPDSSGFSVRLARVATNDVVEWAAPDRIPVDHLLPPPRA